MSFEDALLNIANRVRDYAGSLETEEATKNAIIMPFIQSVLGYDVFDPDEVVPEFVADVGSRKAEKIDYAIKREETIQILVEAKKVGEPLSLEHANQLWPALNKVSFWGCVVGWFWGYRYRMCVWLLM
ncbi:hypothetical protein [Actinomyces oris]|uniref:hypothetical protein n=1 Tax=Actinomyces oris TaxID=544580 RepID=UPI000AD3DBB4|nr:hypothetical protein [Actinomyces oris]